MSGPLAKLALEDGTVYTGRSFGAPGETAGEVVFNTSMMGYQEVLTDPSYTGQIVTMTYPLIGNYGINLEDCESRAPQVEGFIVREATRVPSNFRSHQPLPSYLAENGVIALEGIDTRARRPLHAGSRRCLAAAQGARRAKHRRARSDSGGDAGAPVRLD
jgi:carbamoyl-phosphate synthase small subunit